MSDVVVTGFGPFGDVEYNPSWDAAQACAEQLGVAAILLPVTFEAAARFARDVHDEDLLVVHFGVAVARDVVSLERYAHNWGAEPGTAQPVRLADDGAVAHESALPLDDWANDLNGAAGRIWEVSHCAGTFVCNAIYYHTLAGAAARAALFVHIPEVTADVAREIGRRLAVRIAPNDAACRGSTARNPHDFDAKT